MIVKRAAEVQGRGVSDAVVAAAQDAASPTIEQAQTIQLSIEDQRIFIEAILSPDPPSPASRRAAAAHQRLIKAST